MEQFTAIPASEGLAVGPVCRLRRVQTALGRAVLDPRQEEDAFRAAVAQAKEQLSQLAARAASGEKDIFLAQQMMLEDPGLQQEVLSYLQAGAGAAAAVERAAGIYAGRIRAVEDEYLRERACDVLDACYRVVDVLDGQQDQALPLAAPCILAAEELYPTDILALDRGMLLGIVMGEGSVNSHTSIIARTMGIPAVVMAGRGFLDHCDGRPAALDAIRGEVYLEPDEATKARFAHSIRQARRPSLTEQRLREEPCVTRDGTRIALFANASAIPDVEAAVNGGAEGIGLLLSEYLMAMPGTHDTQEEQYRFYAACLAAAKGRPVTISTYGGSDPQRPQEVNPALGVCGIRYSLAHPDAFSAQLMALLRAGTAGNLRILLPMIASREDLERALDAVHRAKTELRRCRVPFAENVPIGVLIETPAAALMAHELAQQAAFFHISTTNLTQYAHAADRADPAVQEYFPAGSPAVHKLVHMAVDAANEAHIPACVCCESAARPALAETYVRIGVRALSMDMGSMLGVKEYLMGLTL